VVRRFNAANLSSRTLKDYMYLHEENTRGRDEKLRYSPNKSASCHTFVKVQTSFYSSQLEMPPTTISIVGRLQIFILVI
jgi:sarcosine oxidase delta subunit